VRPSESQEGLEEEVWRRSSYRQMLSYMLGGVEVEEFARTIRNHLPTGGR